MASYFNIVLDTTAPAGVSLSLNGGAAYATSQAVTATIGTSDSPTTGYQMLIWGSVDPAANVSIQATQGASSWIAFNTSQAITLLTGDGSKTINVQVRDDVLNPSGTVTQSITLDTAVPVVTIQAGSPDVTKISKIATKNTVTAVWQANEAIQAYKVKVVTAGTDLQSAGTQLLTTNGSTNVTGGSVAATTNVTTTVNGTDLQVASAADGTKVIKIFAQDLAGNWSVA